MFLWKYLKIVFYIRFLTVELQKQKIIMKKNAFPIKVADELMNPENFAVLSQKRKKFKNVIIVNLN